MITAVHGGIEIQIKVIPRSGRTAVAGIRDGALLVRLAAAPVDGAANDALIALLAVTLAVPRRTVTLVSGERSKTKRVRVAGVSVSAAQTRLAPEPSPH
jgi:uncharacterized protein (TIGR00251 family)